MTFRRMTYASAAVALLLAAVAALALRRLPAGAQLPTHWNAAGEAERFAEASTALFMPVFLVVGLSSVFALLPRLEPLQHRLDRSRALLVTAWAGLLAMMALVELMVAAPAFGFHAPATLILAAVGLLFIVVGNMLPKSRPAFFVGIRTPWAILDEDNWVATHRLGAWTMIAGGALILLAALLPIGGDARQVVVFTALAIAILPPFAYSWLLWRRNART